MGKYFTMYRLSLQDGFAYRAPIIVWIFGNIVSFVLAISVWLSSKSSNNLIAGYSKDSLVTYYLLGLLLNLVFNWLAFYSISRKINDGSIVGSLLLKPVSCYFSEFAGNAGWRTIFVSLGLVVFLITGYILRDAFFIPKTEAILMALPSIILTVFVTFSFSLCLGMIAFWTTHTSAIDSAFWMGRLFVGGQVIPISFFPGLYQNLINILPFRYTYSFAIEILTGKLNQNEIIYGYFVQISWLVLFLFLYKFMWYRGRKTYTSFGQ